DRAQEIAVDRDDLEPRELAPKARGRLAQRGAGDIDRQVGRRAQGADKKPRLQALAAAVLDELAALSGKARARRESGNTREACRCARTGDCRRRRRNTSAAAPSAGARVPRSLRPKNLSGYTDARARPMADLAGNAVRGLLDERSPLQLHAVGGRGERERGDQRAVVVADPGGDA